MKRLGTALLVVASVWVLSACASTYDVSQAMRQGGWQKVLSDTQNINEFPERDQTLVMNWRAHAKMALGYRDSAQDDYLYAWNVMNHGKGSSVASVTFGRESGKMWMGDPYERAFNSWYLGMMYFQAGKREDAMASFRNAMFVDTGDLEKGEYAADWLPAFIMRMRCFLARGDTGSVRNLLKEVGRLEREPANFDPNCPWLNIEAQKDANVVMMVELGQGPFFTAEGHHGSERVINQSAYNEAYAEVYVNGEPLGRTYKIGDTFFQCITRGGRVMDDILKGKAIAKTAGIATGATAIFVGSQLARHGHGTAGAITAGVGAAVLVASLLMSTEADTRGNVLLPGETHLMMARLDPGDYDVTLRYFDKNGRELRSMRQDMVPLTVPESGDATLLVRSAPRYQVPPAGSARLTADPYGKPKKPQK